MIRLREIECAGMKVSVKDSCRVSEIPVISEEYWKSINVLCVQGQGNLKKEKCGDRV